MFLVNILFAKSIFWEKENFIESSYYKQIDINQTDEQINILIDNKYKDFNILLVELKNKPYDLLEDNTFNVDEKDSLKLLQRIKINKQYGYDLAVIRDQLKVENIKLKESIYIYFVTLANSWVSFKKDDLTKLDKEYIAILAKIDYAKYFNQFQNVKNIDSKIENNIKKEFEEFNKHYLFFNEILGFIDENQKIFQYKSLTNFLKVGVLVDNINSLKLAKELNPTLRFIYLDVGRVVLSLSVIFFFIFLSYFIYKKIYNLLKKKIFLHDDEIDEILIENLDKIRKPIAFLVIFIGFKLSLDILLHPNSINPLALNIFYIIVILNSIYLAFVFIDNTVFLYLTNKNNDNIRKELVSLIIAILKIVIFLIGLLLILVRFGIDISGILASLGIGGLAVALAAQSTLSNFFGLIKMIVDKSFSIGDWIQTDNIEGSVVKIGFISTKIRTFDNALITVPNSNLANSSIKNWNKRKIGRRIKLHIGVTYSAKQEDIKNAIKQIKEMLHNHPDIITSQKVDYKEINKFYRKEQRLISIDDKYGIKTNLLVYLDSFNDSSIDILIYTFTKTIMWDRWLEVKEDVLLQIWTILENNNLEFAFPSQTLYLEHEKSLTQN